MCVKSAIGFITILKVQITSSTYIIFK